MRVSQINQTNYKNRQAFGCKNCDKVASYLFDHVAGIDKEIARKHFVTTYNDQNHEVIMKNILELFRFKKNLSNDIDVKQIINYTKATAKAAKQRLDRDYRNLKK